LFKGHPPEMAAAHGLHRAGKQPARQEYTSQFMPGLHAPPPSTMTFRNMPALAWLKIWQWNAHSPGSSTSTSKVTSVLGFTLMTCLVGLSPLAPTFNKDHIP